MRKLGAAVLYDKNLRANERLSLFGIVHSLKENGIPFRIVENTEDTEYCTVLLPSLSSLHRLREEVKKHVSAGGGLVVAGCDVHGAELEFLGIKQVKGAIEGKFRIDISGESFCAAKSSATYMGRVLMCVPAPSASVHATISDHEGCYPCIIAQRSIVYFPFDIYRAIIEWETESYARSEDVYKSAQRYFLKVYWSLPPYLRSAARSVARRARRKATKTRIKYTQWPMEFSADVLKMLVAQSVRHTCRDEILPVVWRWPNDCRAAMVVTHDADTRFGIEKGLRTLIEIEEEHGIRTTWNLIADGKQYKLSAEALQELRSKSMEVSAHGLCHDGMLDKVSQDERRARISEARRKLESMTGDEVRGFRAPWLLRTDDMWQALEDAGYLYDTSYPDTDHLTLTRSGMGVATNMPYHPVVSDEAVRELRILELPLSAPQDVELFIERRMSNEEAYKIWTDKMDSIYARSGLVSFLFHSDKSGVSSSRRMDVYRRLLEHAKSLDGLWVATAGEIRRWWSARENISIDANVNGQKIETVIVNRNTSPFEGLTIRMMLAKGKNLRITGGQAKLLRVEEKNTYRIAVMEVPKIDADSQIAVSLELETSSG